MPDNITGAALLHTVGLMPDGPAILGRPIRASGPGVYVIEVATPMTRAPIDMTVVARWIDGLPGLRLDGEAPTPKLLATRLAGFWLASSQVLFVGSTDNSIGGRVMALERHVLGQRRPHASSQWIKTLRVDGLRVWWASTTAPEEYEDALLAAFGATIPAEERAALVDPSVVLPFANMRTPSGERKQTGITGGVVPEEPVAPTPPTRLVDVAPGDADGVPEARNAGTTRRTNVKPPPPAGVRRPRAPTPAGRSTAGAAATARTLAAMGRPALPPVELTPDGHARLLTEHRDLTQGRRPEVIDRIRRARELGDLKENADYTSAREEQSFLEGRILAIEAQLRNATVIQPTDGHRVGLGSHVTVLVNGEETEFTIVGPTESDPGNGRISNASPVGRALVGLAAGDKADVATPRGVVRYHLVTIA